MATAANDDERSLSSQTTVPVSNSSQPITTPTSKAEVSDAKAKAAEVVAKAKKRLRLKRTDDDDITVADLEQELTPEEAKVIDDVELNADDYTADEWKAIQDEEKRIENLNAQIRDIKEKARKRQRKQRYLTWLSEQEEAKKRHKKDDDDDNNNGDTPDAKPAAMAPGEAK